MNTFKSRLRGNEKITEKNISNSNGLIYLRSWLIIVAALVLFDFIATKNLGFDVDISDILKSAGISLTGIGTLYGISKIKRYTPFFKLINLQGWVIALLSCVSMKLFLNASMVLQSLAVAANAPLVDDALIGLDRIIGFRWDHLVVWYFKHPDIEIISKIFYALWTPQVILTLLILSIKNKNHDLIEFIFLFSLISLISITTSAFFPASNPFFHYKMVDPYGQSPWSQFYPLRDGRLRSVNFGLNEGLVSFPSMHAAAAVLFAYAVRHIKFLFPVSIAANFAMAISAIFGGAHYFVDIVSGLLLSVAVICISRRILGKKTLARRAGDPVQTSDQTT